MPIAVTDILIRFFTEFGPEGAHQAIKAMHELMEAGVSAHRAAEKVAVSMGLFTEESLKAAGGVEKLTGGISKQAVLMETWKALVTGHYMAMKKSRAMQEELTRQIEFLKKRVDELTVALEKQIAIKKHAAEVFRGLSPQVKALALLLLEFSKRTGEVKKLLELCAAAGYPLSESLDLVWSAMKKNEVTFMGATLTAKEFKEVLKKTTEGLERTGFTAETVRKAKAELAEAMRLAEAAIAGVDVQARRLAPAFTKMEVALVSLSAIFLKFVRDTVREATKWAESVYRIYLLSGMAAEEATRFTVTLEYLGVGMGALTRPFSMLLRQIASVRKNLALATKIQDEYGKFIGYSSEKLARFGIVLVDVEGKARPLRDIIADLADIYVSFADRTTALEMAQMAFGFQYRALLPYLELGREGILALEERLAAHIELSQEQMRMLVGTQFALRELQIAWRGLRIEIATYFAPALTEVLELLSSLIRAYRVYVPEGIREFIIHLGVGLATLAAFTKGITLATKGLGLLGKILTKIAGFLGLGTLATKGLSTAMGALGIETAALTGALGGFLVVAAKVVGILALIALGIEAIEALIGVEIVNWTHWIDVLGDWITQAEEVEETMERIRPVPVPPLVPPAPPFPWVPLLEQMTADMIRLWEATLPAIRERIESELILLGYAGEELRERLSYAMAEMRLALAEFILGTRDTLTISVNAVSIVLRDFERLLGLSLEAIRAERAVEAAKEAVRELRERLRELKEDFREEVAARREQVEIAKERLELAKEAVDALRFQLRELRARQREIESAQAEVVALARERVEAAKREIEEIKAAQDALQEAIDREVEERLRLLGIIIDPARLEALRDAVADAKAMVEEARGALERARARRERYGLLLMSWEELNAQAALEMAEAAEERAESALREYERQERVARRVRREIEAQYEDERRLLEERLEAAEDRLALEKRALADARAALRRIKLEHEKERLVLERRIREAEEHAEYLESIWREERRAFEAWKRERERQLRDREDQLEWELELREAALRMAQAHLESLREQLAKAKLIMDAHAEAYRDHVTAKRKYLEWERIQQGRIEEELGEYAKETEEHADLLSRLIDWISETLWPKIKPLLSDILRDWALYGATIDSHTSHLGRFMGIYIRDELKKADRQTGKIGHQYALYSGQLTTHSGWVSSLITKITRLQIPARLRSLIARWSQFGTLFGSFVRGFVDFIVRISATMREILRKIREALRRIFGRHSPSLGEELGRQFHEDLAKGLEMSRHLIEEAIRETAAVPVKYLAFGSVPEKGPLRRADVWMPNFVNLLARQLRTSRPLLEAEIGRLAEVLRIPEPTAINVYVDVRGIPRPVRTEVRVPERELEYWRTFF